MTAEDLFESPATLIRWAYEDAQRFAELEHSFFGPESYQRIVEFDEKMGRDAHRIRIIKDLPPEFRKLSSHIINDLRHSLDQAFVAASRFFGWKPPDNNPRKVLYFPWARDLADLKGQLRQIPEEIHEILIASQPYAAQNDGTGGDNEIRELGRIAGPNKHEAVLGSGASAVMKSMRIDWNADWRVPFEETMWDGTKKELTFGYFPPNTEGHYDVEAALFVTFRDIPALSGIPASNLFAKWGRYTESVVSALEERVAGALRA